ncbi:hypothetical protein B1218_35530 [Pseudomonas ogarae]|nr:hypothetical protein B1218_35530 [Pseudomonas ogarae]
MPCPPPPPPPPSPPPFPLYPKAVDVARKKKETGRAKAAPQPKPVVQRSSKPPSRPITLIRGTESSVINVR